ncbi:hypothetical protein DAPPUDRAFT_346837 [Daphnia pulex]|uniref:Gustatory receptor n=1 Tax=Daphnia pulex TaxID=6669 RepID=E9FXE8_DAPPU|nr:hypothetical protein DAPPUDRAFT_346837 [Daphnia pulex]|eukprot:EFX88065.1 hypothetical protein DAPPUDRAFT_346837 [Daphnia pulex]
MSTRTSSFSEETSEQQIIGWAWSIRPLIIWARILGVDLSDVSPSSDSHQWLTVAYGIFCFLLHISGEINSIYYLYTTQTVHVSLEQSYGLLFVTTTATWNWTIDFINYVAHGIGVHVILVTVVQAQWKDLMKIFQRLQEEFPDANYIQIRRLSLFGVAYVILMISGLVAASVTDYHLAAGSSSIHSIFITITSTLSIIYPLTTIVLFAVHCYASSVAFELIRTKIGRGRHVRILLLTLKNRFILASDTVDGINRTFGWMLLLSTTFFFVAIINASYVVFSLDKQITAGDLVFLLFALVHLTLVCFAADHITINAEEMIGDLLRCKCDKMNKEYQIEMEYLISDMLHEIPQISANGCFNVNKRLIPQVIGTTATYFFILCQFEESEKKVCPVS